MPSTPLPPPCQRRLSRFPPLATRCISCNVGASHRFPGGHAEAGAATGWPPSIDGGAPFSFADAQKRVPPPGNKKGNNRRGERMSDNYDNFRQWESTLKTKKTASRTGTLGVREGKRQFGQLGTTFYKVRRPNRAALVSEVRRLVAPCGWNVAGKTTAAAVPPGRGRSGWRDRGGPTRSSSPVCLPRCRCGSTACRSRSGRGTTRSALRRPRRKSTSP